MIDREPSRTKLVIYWILWAVTMAVLLGGSVFAIMWIALVYGVHGYQ